MYLQIWRLEQISIQYGLGSVMVMIRCSKTVAKYVQNMCFWGQIVGTSNYQSDLQKTLYSNYVYITIVILLYRMFGPILFVQIYPFGLRLAQSITYWHWSNKFVGSKELFKHISFSIKCLFWAWITRAPKLPKNIKSDAKMGSCVQIPYFP